MQPNIRHLHDISIKIIIKPFINRIQNKTKKKNKLQKNEGIERSQNRLIVYVQVKTECHVFCLLLIKNGL